MKLHLLALPHTRVDRSEACCAYTQKVRKFCKMMGRGQGGEGSHEIVLYGSEIVDAPGITDHVVCITESERAGWFGSKPFDTVNGKFEWDSDRPYWKRFEERAVAALKERGEIKDLLLLTTSAQKPIADAVSETLMPLEWAVGYEGVRLDKCAFESYAWMHHVYGLTRTVNGRPFDAVIPNFFDVNDFAEPGPANPRGKYLLYLGRVTARKGPHIAGQIAAKMGMKLVVAGPGATQEYRGAKIQGECCVIDEGDVVYAGIADEAMRADLMSGAACCLLPTLYVEPFGGVAIEAMMSGCPVVASDWGAFTETVTPEVGRRFRTLSQGCQAVDEAMRLNRIDVAAHARSRYSLDAVRPQFTRWFDQIQTLWGKGWYE